MESEVELTSLQGGFCCQPAGPVFLAEARKWEAVFVYLADVVSSVSDEHFDGPSGVVVSHPVNAEIRFQAGEVAHWLGLNISYEPCCHFHLLSPVRR